MLPWIKQHLRIKKFYGYSENAVRTQLWIAVATYCLLAIIKKKLGGDRDLHEIQEPGYLLDTTAASRLN